MWQIKSNYQQRESVDYYDQVESARIHQPHVYAFAKYLCETLNIQYVVDIGCGNGKKLSDFPAGVQKIGIDYGSNLEKFQNNNPGAQVIEIDLESHVPVLDEDVIANSIVICADVLEHLHSPDTLLKYLSILSHTAPFILISTPDRIRLRGIGDLGPPENPWHLREWTSEELHALFQEYAFKPGFWGYTINNNELLNKTTSLYIGGKFNGFEREVSGDLSAVAVISVFNEKDIIGQTITHYLNQGIHVHVIDNWSDNGTFEKVLRLAKQSESLTYERFPAEGSAGAHQWKEMLDRKVAYSLEAGFDWAMHVDADELIFPPWPGVSLLDGIRIIDSLGFNTFELSRFDFRPTRPGFYQKINPKKFFHHFEFFKYSLRFIRGWKILPGNQYDLSSTGGHHIQFSGQKLYPIRFENHHFPYRSLKQMQSKLYADRLPRIKEGVQQRGWHKHYIDFAASHGIKLWKPEHLLTDAQNTREEYLLERLSGIGLPVERRDGKRIDRQYADYLSGKFETFEEVPGLLSKENEDLRGQVDQLTAHIAEIKNTRSWRLLHQLEPLRLRLLQLEKFFRPGKKKVERIELQDPSTGARVIRWTDHPATDQHLYFTSPSVTDDGRFLVFISDRDGHPNLYQLTRKNGRIHQLTDNQDGLLKSYVYPNGTSRGLSKASPCLDSSRKLLYFNQSNRIFSIHLGSGRKKHIHNLPAGWITAFTHVSQSGKLLCVPITEPQHFTAPARHQGEQMRHIGEIEKNNTVNSKILIIDTQNGHLVQAIDVPFWVTHVQFNPTDDTQVIFNHEGLRENIPQRIWALNLSTGKFRPLFEQDHNLWCTHENWLPSGRGIVFHGGDRNDPDAMFIACRDWNGNPIFNYSFTNLEIVHAIATQVDARVLVDQRNGWISLIDTSSNHIIKLCELHTDFRTQDSHAHPVQTPTGNSIVFTSNQNGACNIYEVFPTLDQ